jgi:fructose-bisphosphate aldolase class II
MKSLKSIIDNAKHRGIAVGHFNISDTATFRAVVDSAKELNLPVIIGTSEGERDFLGAENAVSLVYNLRETHDLPIFLNADHTYSLEKVKEAALLGYDSIIFDGAKLPYEENIKQTKEAVKIAKDINADIIVEGELGYIGQSSALLDKLPEGAQVTDEMLTSAAQAKEFIKETGVDLFAPAVGNIHGMLSNAPNPALNIERIKEISAAVKSPLVLHGGSGLRDEEFVAAAQNGMSIIHISTEIRLAWRKGLERSLTEKPREVAPYKLLSYSVAEMKKVISGRLKLFSGL